MYYRVDLMLRVNALPVSLYHQHIKEVVLLTCLSTVSLMLVAVSGSHCSRIRIRDSDDTSEMGLSGLGVKLWN